MTRLVSVAAAVLLAIVAFVPGAVSSSASVRLQDVAGRVGLDFRQGAFRFGLSADPVAMMGSGLCWLDYDRDGWLDLFVVNNRAERDDPRWRKSGGLPRSALFRNVKGKFVDVSRRSGADLALRGMGCVAADLDLDGDSDLYVTAAGVSALLWNNGNGTFREGAAAAGVAASGWRSSAAVGDVNGDGRPDLFVGGYTDLNAPIAGSSAGFPTSHAGVRDLLYLNLGRSRFREVGREAGLETARFDHTLGAVFSDLDRDGRLDLYVANDEDPNRLYENVAWPGGARADPAGLGFRFEERAGGAGAADPNAGMGVANADADGDGLADLFVSNSRGQQHAVLNGLQPGKNGASFADGRPGFAAAFGRSFTGWGVSWADLDLDGDPDLVLANGSIPVTNLARDAQPIQVLENQAAQGKPRQFSDAGVSGLPLVVGRGLAVADYDNDGRLDVAINSVAGRLILLRSTAAAGNWLEVALSGFHPGARVTAVLPDGRRLVREVQAGSSYLSSEDPRVHFGLGQATTVAELVVRFPSGRETRLGGVSANRVVTVREEPWRLTGCVPARGRSVARVWDEAVLGAIRRDVPAPTTHARNLFHLSAAMWDAWVAYDRTADGYFSREKLRAADVQTARETAISYAAYRVLLWRYAQGAGLQTTFDALTGTMTSLCLSPGFANQKGDTPAALGNRIAAAVIKSGLADGSLERLRYADPSYQPVNEPLVVALPGTTMHDPTFWQPLALTQIITQNGLAVPGRVQSYIGAQWGHVRSFALAASKKGVPIDPGKPAALGSPETEAYKQAAVDVIRLSSELDPNDETTTDIGPGGSGDNPLGTNGGNGYELNPITGKPYAPNPARRADFGRVVAEFWADGPSSETPPGHWNVLANGVSDSPLLAARIGPGAANRLKWDVRLYFALNGAVHDAAIAAWGIKRAYNGVRPISMIRYLAGKGQSTDPAGPSYDREGLPLVPGLIEVVTSASSAPGQRHAALAGHVGEIAIRAWRGKAGVGWGLGIDWVPYQRPTFVTPAFPGFVSGHSTFSRAAAEVMTGITGSQYFPGGLFEQTFEPGYLAFEQGPSAPVTLQSATYYDAADQAGISRIYGGIHVTADDFGGRRVGSTVGKRAWALAQRYFDGSAGR